MDYIEFDDGFAIVKWPPQSGPPQTLAESGLPTRYGVTIVGVKKPGEDFTYAKPETLVRPDDLLIVSGRSDVVDQFAMESTP